jgi:hypothetical protein
MPQRERTRERFAAWNGLWGVFGCFFDGLSIRCHAAVSTAFVGGQLLCIRFVLHAGRISFVRHF